LKNVEIHFDSWSQKYDKVSAEWSHRADDKFWTQESCPFEEVFRWVHWIEETVSQDDELH